VARALGLVGCLVLGFLVGVVGAFVQAARILAGGLTIPWGLLLMLGALLVCVRLGLESTGTRWGGWCVFGAWLGATIVFAAEMPSGALVIAAGDRQMAYLFGGVVVGAAAATVPPLRRLRRP
jgi:hypothetical protein